MPAQIASSPAPPRQPDQFQFAIVSDRTGGHRGHVFESGVDKANLLLPDFVMSVGDLVEGYTTEPAEIAEQWEEFRNIVANFEMPFYFVPGNHDLSNPIMAAAWKEQFGPSYYYFVYHDVLFLCLNTEDGAPSHVSDEQVEYMRRALADNPKVRWTLLFMHRPLWNTNEEPSGRAAFERIESYLVGRPYTVFAGHYHTYKKSVRNDRRYIVLATTGGGSQLKGPLYGQFDELAWVTMTNSGPRLANVLLDGVLDEDVRTDESAARVDDINKKLLVRVDNLYSQNGQFAGGATRVHVENQTAGTIQFDAQIGASAPIEPTPHRIEPTFVPAGQSLVFPIKLRIPKPTPLTKLSGMPIQWSAKILDGGAPFVLRDTLGFGVSQLYDIQRRTRPVVVDGRLDEWGKLAFAPQGVLPPADKDEASNRIAPADLSFSFDLTYDDENVYVAVQVRDDVVVSESTKYPWLQDGIEVSIDVRDEPERAANRRIYSDAWKTYAYLAVSPPDDQGGVSLFDRQRIPKTVRVVCVRTPDGYAAEMAFPHAALNATRPQGEWRSLRFNVGIQEHDAPSVPGTTLWWQPDWHWDSNVPGSGTFKSSRRN
ncbi:MAG: sugar-binding protein [Myxococcota bacterium]